MSKKWWENDPIASDDAGEAGADDWYKNDPVAEDQPRQAKPPKDPNRSALADVGKSVGGSVLNALGAIPTAGGRAIREGGEMLIGLSMDEAQALAEAEGKPEKAQQYYERSNMLNPVSKLGGVLESMGGWLAEKGDQVRDSRSEEAKELARQSTPTGDLTKPSTWGMGDAPSVEGAAHVMSDVVGSLVPQVAAAITTRGKSATTQMTVGGTVGASQIGGAAIQEANEYLGGFTDDKLREVSPVFRELEAKGYSPEDARTIITRDAENRAATYAAPVGFVGGQATAAILGKAGDRIASGIKGIGGKAAVLGALGATEEGLQEVGEGIATRAGINDATGTERSLTEGTFPEFVLGAAGGGVVGTGKGLAQGVGERMDARQTETPPAATPPQAPVGTAPNDTRTPMSAADFERAISGRRGELERKANGTKDQAVIGPDGKPMTIPGQKAEFLTEAELRELDVLRKGETDLERLAEGYGVRLETPDQSTQPPTTPESGNTTQTTTAPDLIIPPQSGVVNDQGERAAELAYITERLAEITPANGYGPAFDQERAELTAKAQELTAQNEQETKGAQQAPTDFWSFAKSKGYTPSQIKIGTPVHAALKSEYDTLRAGKPAPVLPSLQPQQDVNLQNRDRGRAASVAQMSELARNPDYMRLGPSRTPDSGAPMVFAVGDQLSAIEPQNFGREDVAVMSDGQRVPFRYAVVDASQVNPSNFADGRQNPDFNSTTPGTIKALNNGRTAGLRAAHEMGTAGEYVSGMQADEAMHGIPADVIARTPNPVLVRVYADANNTAGMAAKSQGQGLGMSPAELARQDAPLLDSSVLGVYRPGDVTSADNRDFVRAFVGKLQGAGQDVAGMMTADGQLSQDGRKRIQAALMQAAYGDSNIVEEMFDSTDTDIKAIGEALKSVAGQWADMRDSARLGAISPQTDITENLLQAIGLIRKARRDRTSLHDLVNQPDLMTGEGPSAMTVGVLRMFYTGEYLTRAIGRDKLTQNLNDYVTASMATSADAGMFGDVVTPAEILATINPITEGQSNAETQPEDGRGQPAGGIDPGRGAGEVGQADGGQVAGEGGPGPDQDRRGEPEENAEAKTQQQDGQGDQGTQKGDEAASVGATGGQSGVAGGQAAPAVKAKKPTAQTKQETTADKPAENTLKIDDDFDPTGWVKSENKINKKTGQPTFQPGIERYKKTTERGTSSVITRDGKISQARTMSPEIELENSSLNFDGLASGRIEINDLNGQLVFIGNDGFVTKMSPRAEQEYKAGVPIEKIAENEFTDAGGIRPDGSKTEHTTKGRIKQETPADNSDWMGELFGGEAQPAKPQPAAPAKPARNKARLQSVLATAKSEAEAALADWQGRNYKDNKKQVNFEGDGPTRNESMSITAINEGRKRKNIDALTQEIKAIERMESMLADEKSAERLLGMLEQTMEQAEANIANGTATIGKTPSEAFEYDILQRLDIKPAQGSITSNKVSKALLSYLQREVVTPDEDTNVGVNANGEKLYERKDGSRYRMDNGKPSFGGDLAPVEVSQVNVNDPANKGQWNLVSYEERTKQEPYIDERGEERTRTIVDWDRAEVSAGSGQRIGYIYELEHKQTGERRLFGRETAHIAMGVTPEVALQRAQKLNEEKARVESFDKAMAKGAFDSLEQAQADAKPNESTYQKNGVFANVPDRINPIRQAIDNGWVKAEGPATTTTKASLEELQYRVKNADPFSEEFTEAIAALNAAAVADAEKSLNDGEPAVYASTTGLTSVLTPSAKKPGQYQVTRYTENGIIGDSQYKTVADAIKDDGLQRTKRLYGAEAEKHLEKMLEAEAEYQAKKAKATPKPETGSANTDPALRPETIQAIAKGAETNRKRAEKQRQDFEAGAGDRAKKREDIGEPTWQEFEGVQVLRVKNSQFVAVPTSGRQNSAKFDIVDIKNRDDIVAQVTNKEVRPWLTSKAGADADIAALAAPKTKSKVDPATTDDQVRTLNEEGRATDGKPINPGDVFSTLSGRKTTGYPKQKGEKYASQWLINNALMEAESRGDSFNARTFNNTKPMKDGTLTTADRESMLMYLFGEQPNVVPSILKPLTESGSAAPEGLTAPTPDDIRAQETAKEKAAADKKAADAKADSQDAKDRERKEIAKASEAAADTFELGQDPMANLTGQQDVFSAATEPQETKPTGKIEDLGEKIGGARKDTATSTGRTSRSKPKDDRPAWARRFEVSQIVAGDNEGRWTIHDNRTKDWMGNPKQVGGRSNTFATEQEALDAVPLAAVSMKHRAVPTGTKNENGEYNFEIWRDINDRKRVKVVDQVFPSRVAALEYMAKNAQAILETNTTFGEADLPTPDRTDRTGVSRRSGDVQGSDFMETFGFRGVEFGNWNNQIERQEVMNAAYDGLMDLAEVMGIPPKAIGLNGDLALAFGARGQGLSSAKAHYEMARSVINLTKMNGAGALAHEWFHALDHYFSRQDGKSSSQWKVAADGTRTFDVRGGEDDMASGGFKRVNSGVRQELRDAYKNVMETMFNKAEQYVEDTSKADQFVAKSREDVARALDSMRKDLSEQKDVRYYKRNNKPASAEQLAEFDTVAKQIMDGEALEIGLVKVEGSRTATGSRWSNEALERLSAIYKAVRGRSGFDATNQSGVMDKLRGDMVRYSQRLKMLADAQAGDKKTKRVPTEFAMNAKELDQGRGENYWTTPHEMAARAFQGYVEDKIAAQGASSPFLNYAPENIGILTPWGAKRPFPYGQERKAINEAFDAFVETIETRETEQGVTMFSRGQDFAAEVDQAIEAGGRNDTQALRQQVSIGATTPAVLRMLGVEEKPVYTNRDMIAKMHLEHGVPKDQLKNLAGLLENPAMVFESDTQPGRFVVVTDVVVDGQPLVIAVEPNGKSQDLKVVYLPSAYPKDNANAKFTSWIKAGKILYADKSRSRLLATNAGLQLPGVVARPVGFTPVKYKTEADIAQAGLSRRVGASGMDLKELDALVARAKAKLPNMPKVHVMKDPSTAPKALRDYITLQGAWGDVEGAMHNGELYLFASGLRDTLRAEHVLIEHEAAHYGLRAVLGPSLKTAMNLIYANNPSVRKAATEMQKRGKLSNAEAVEEVIVDIPTSELVKLKGWRNVVRMMAEYLGRMGYERTAKKLTDWLNGSLTDQERADLFVAELVHSARDFVAGKYTRGRPGSYAGVTRLSKGLAEDIARQEKWLTAEAKARGFKDIEDLMDNAYPVFEKLAAKWRENNPAEDGVLLSRGQDKKTDTPAFKRWFGDSKVVDAKAKPLVVYHASTSPIDEFKPKNYGTAGDHSYFYFAASESWSKKFAKESLGVDKPSMHKVYLSIQNPLDLRGEARTPAKWIEFFNGIGVAVSDKFREKLNAAPAKQEIAAWQLLRFDTPENGAMRERLIDAGYDGIVMNDVIRGKMDNTTFVSFQPTQIKSATGNDGSFDPANPDIRFSRAEPDVTITEDSDEGTLYAVTATIPSSGDAFITAEANADGSFQIQESGVPESNRGQGLGVRLYEGLIRNLFERGANKVTSDNSVSADAQRMYQKLRSLGYVVEQSPDAVLDPETGALESDKPIFTVRDKAATSNSGAMLSRAEPKKTTSERADEILTKSAGRAAPLDYLSKTLTRVTGVERLTGAIYDRAGFLLDRYTPEKVKAGVVADYGVPEAVIDQRTLLQGRQRVQLRKAGELIDKLSTLTREESRVAYEWMNMDGQDPKAYMSMMQGLPEESVKVLTDVQKMIDQLSKEAVRLGQLSPDAYERNKFAYLRRSYAKHILEQTAGEKAKRARVISILGDQYKGRGMTEAAPMDKIKATDWWKRKDAKGQADTALKGEKFVRLEYRTMKENNFQTRRYKNGKIKVIVGTREVAANSKAAQFDGMEVREQETRLRDVVYWPASEPIPKEYAEWDKAGTWEVRDVKGPNAIFWRDFTKDEREVMGEVDEARFAIAKTLHAMIHDVEVGRYMEWMATNQAKKEGETIPGVVVEASERMRDTFAPNEWVRVPDTKISGTNVHKYGKLAGRYLPGPVWNDLRQVVNGQFKPFGETYAQILSMWKTSKTALSPGVHMNNVMSNFVMADFHDVGATHVAKSLRILMAASKREGKGALGNLGNQLARGGIADREAATEILNRYKDSGGDIGSWVTNEIAQDQLEPLLASMEKELQATAGNSVQAQTGVFSALQHALMLRFPSAWAAFKPSLPGRVITTEAQNLIDLYQHEDDVFRLAAWLKAKEDGATDLAAGKVARKSFLDYNINAPWIQAMRQSAWPFISFTYRAVPMLAEVAGKKPHKLLKLMMVLGTLNALGSLLAGGDDEEERKLLPEEKAGRIWGMVPKLIRMPWNDDHGSAVYLDIRRFIPVGDVFDVSAGQAAIPIFPGLTPGGPLVVAGEVVLNKSAFTGKSITLDTDTGAQQAAKVADHLYKQFMPNILGLPNTYATTGVMGSLTGRTDAFGREMSTAQATASAFGVKLGSYPADVLRRNLNAKAQAELMEIQKNISQLKRQRQTNRLDNDEYREAVEVELAKKQKIMQELQDKLR